MHKSFSLFLSSVVISILLMIACEKDAKAPVPSPPPVLRTSFIEEFDTVANLSQKGWVIRNNSQPFGPMAWRQGKYELGGKLGSDVVGFPAFSAVYNPNEFVSVDLNAGAGVSLLSCWLVTPPLPLKNGDQLKFYTRSHGDYSDRLQVRGNFSNGSENVGTAATEVGDFNMLLLEINESLVPKGYPVVWTPYTLTITGLPVAVPPLLIKARIAFRYYVPNGGPGGVNSDMIGIDKFEFISK